MNFKNANFWIGIFFLISFLSFSISKMESILRMVTHLASPLLAAFFFREFGKEASKFKCISCGFEHYAGVKGKINQNYQKKK